MNYKKYFLLLLLMSFSLVTICACNDDSPYEAFFDEKQKEEVINLIPKTKKDVVITYQQNLEDKTIIILYNFNNNISVSKEIYFFYNDINHFREALFNYNAVLDGTFQEINEQILLIHTIFNDIDNETYQVLESKINELIDTNDHIYLLE